MAQRNVTRLSLAEFTDFVLKYQHEAWDVDRCKDAFEKFTGDGIGMDLDHFSAYLLSSKNRIFNKNYMEINQDMHQPLNEYFINSSHNTYLTGDQLLSESSVEGYIRALQKGCRCLEIDIHDGQGGEPLVYHGRTLTSKITFRNAIETIHKYAFHSSDWPLILSLEVRCSIEQQDRMAEILIDVLGDSLLKEPVDNLVSETLPSPSMLMKKILIKGKTSEEDDDDEPDAAAVSA